MLISNNSSECDAKLKVKNNPTQVDVSRNQRSQRYGYSIYSLPPTSDPNCTICDSKEEHVSTAGPGGTRIIQYYACKSFAELTPANRFALLKNKGYCFQCLLPGAAISSGKHKMGDASMTTYVHILRIKAIPFANTY